MPRIEIAFVGLLGLLGCTHEQRIDCGAPTGDNGTSVGAVSASGAPATTCMVAGQRKPGNAARSAKSALLEGRDRLGRGEIDAAVDVYERCAAQFPDASA